MSASKTPWSGRIRAYRERHGITQEKLGQRLAVDPKIISAWERGRRPTKREHVDALCDTLTCNRRELYHVDSEEVDRRGFVRGAAGLGVIAVMSPLAGYAYAVGRIGIDERSMQGYEEATEALEALWYRAGAAATIGPAIGHVEAISRLLAGPMPAGMRPRLLRVYGAASGLVALLKSAIGDPHGAASYADMALQAAREAEDDSLGVWVLLRWTACEPAYQDDLELRRRRFTQGDLGFSVAKAPPPTRAWAACKAADVQAELGDHEACVRSLDRAEGLLARPASDRQRRTYWDTRWLAGERGASLAKLGRAAEARKALGIALSKTGADLPGEQLWLQFAMARTYVATKELDAAATVASQVAEEAQRLQEGSLIRQIRRLRQSMNVIGSPTPAIRKLDEELALA